MKRALLALAATAACAQGRRTPNRPGDTADPGPAGSFAIEHREGRTGADGILAVEVPVAGPTTSFLVTGESDRFVGVERLLDPSGAVVTRWQDWWYSDRYLTYAFFGFDRTTAFNWPIREDEGDLAPGTWTVELYTANSDAEYVGDADVALAIHTKQDADRSIGDLTAHVVWAEGVSDDAAVVDAVEQAVERWRAVWQESGAALVETWSESTLDPELGFAWTGSEEVASVSARFDEDALLMVVGETVDGDLLTYGVAGGIPGTLAASPMTYVVVSWLAHAGTDAVFADEEIRLMGETMAHEASHYAGLFHPVDYGRRYNATRFDALSDTPECPDYYSCDALAPNLMYPYSVCDYDGSCVPQHVLTAGQRGVLHRYTGAL